MPDTILLLGPSVRSFRNDRAAIDEAAKEFDIVFATEAPVQTWHPDYGEYIEILDCSPGAADLQRLNNGGPFLREHDRDCQIGVHVSGSVRMDADKKGRARIKMGSSARALEEWADITSGVRQNISVSYQPEEFVLEKTDVSTGLKTYRVSKWVALENSLVSVPADNDCKVGRSQRDDGQTKTPVTIRDPHNLLQKKTMSDPIPAPVPAPAPPIDVTEVRAEAMKAERKRQADIRAVTAALKRDGKDVSAKEAEFLSGEHSADEFRFWCLENAYNARPVSTRENARIEDKDARRFSLLRAVTLIADGKQLDGVEAEVHQELAKRSGMSAKGFFITRQFLTPHTRSVTAGVATSGGTFVDSDLLSGELIELLRNSTLMETMGARKLTGLVGNILIPKQTGGGTAYWLSETATATTSDQATGQLGLVPNRLVAVTPYSKQFMAQSSISAENFVRSDLENVINIKLDLAAINGLGAAGEPRGIINTPSVGTATFGAAATRAKAIDIQKTVAVANASRGALAYLTTPATAAKWLNISEGTATSDFLWKGDIDQGQVVGRNAYSTNQVPSDKVIYGNFNDLILAEWAAMDVIVDPYSRKKEGLIELQITVHADVGVRHAESFVVSTDSGAQ